MFPVGIGKSGVNVVHRSNVADGILLQSKLFEGAVRLSNVRQRCCAIVAKDIVFEIRITEALVDQERSGKALSALVTNWLPWR